MINLGEMDKQFQLANKRLLSTSAKISSFIELTGSICEYDECDDLTEFGYDRRNTYYVISGQILVADSEKELFLYETGDLIFPSQFEQIPNRRYRYAANSNVKLINIEPDKLVLELMKSSQATQAWIDLHAIYSYLFTSVIAERTPEAKRATPGFKRFGAGEVIIYENTYTDYVYTLIEGSAIATCDGVKVGEIENEQIFGALSVLTKQKTTASVIAQGVCLVLMVHRDEFSDVIFTHPKLFLSILEDLASTIISLNQKVAELSAD
jgi:CRP/FNR family transcriptional regulator, cyclic AMP receptor protein